MTSELSRLRAAYDAADLRHLFGPVCMDCHLPVIAATGNLLAGRCGPCDTAHSAPDERAA